MIYEIVITPHAFEELLASDHHTDHLASLKNLLLPDDELGNVVVADLDTDNWVRSIKAALARVPPTQKLRAQGFVKKLLGYVEPHPRQTNPMLEVEAGWINEAGSGINADFIDVVFVSRQAGKCERSLRISSISDPKLRSHKFRRSGVDVLTEEKQEEVFQRVLRLCDWCFIDLPYLAGSLANESITALQLIEIGAKSGALRNSPLHIDIRCQEDKEPSLRSGELKNSLERAIQHSGRNREVSCSVYCCGRKKNRAMFAGLLLGLDCKKPNRKLRWRIQMPHVRSRINDEAEGDWIVTPFSDAMEKLGGLRAEMRASRAPIFTVGNAPAKLSW